MTVQKKRARAKPMPAQKRVVAQSAPPIPRNQKSAEAAFALLRDTILSLEAAHKEELRAKECKDALAEQARQLAESLRIYTERSGIAPGFNEEALLFPDGLFEMQESSRESVYLTASPKDFIAEARARGVSTLFVRVKEEPNLAAFLLNQNRERASKFRSANIEYERAVVLSPHGTKTRLRYVLNEQNPRWEVMFPRK